MKNKDEKRKNVWRAFSSGLYTAWATSDATYALFNSKSGFSPYESEGNLTFTAPKSGFWDFKKGD